MFTFSEDYTIKSVLDMIGDESKRIASLGLASSEEISNFTDQIIRKAFDDSGDNVGDILRSLSVLHGDLMCVKLPGDFEKTAGTKEKKLQDFLPKAPEQESEEKEEGDEEEEAEAVEEPKGYEVVYSSLRDIVYKLASNGDHERAYNVERIINKIDAIVARGNEEEIEDAMSKLKTVLAEGEGPSPFEQEPVEQPAGEPTIAVNKFVTRQTPDSKFSHFNGSWDQLVQLVKQNFNQAKPGYMEGVKLVPVPADGFFTSITELKPGANIAAKYEARREGEDPYMQLTMSGGEKIPAKTADVVIYSHDVLAKNNENSTDADWEIISINASPWTGTEGESEPLMPDALMRNYFGEPGGSQMEGVTPEQFVEMLKKSRDYWRNKIMLG